MRHSLRDHDLPIYVSDLEKDLVSKVAKLADDTKIGGKAMNIKECIKIKRT